MGDEDRMEEKIGVIVSTYNGSKYIIEQLNSIVNQTKLVDKLYIFDDHSIDDTVKVVKQYLMTTTICFEIIVNKKNKGWKKNYIDALKYVKEDYIFLADQDDIWASNKVEIMTNLMWQNNEINVLSSNYELFFSEESTTEKLAEEKRLSKDGKLHKYDQKPVNFYIRQPGCSLLVRKSFFDKYSDLWNENMPHDSFLWKIALLSDSLYSINKPLFKWRRHSTNESNRTKIKKEMRIKEVNSNYYFMSNMNKKHKNYLSDQALKFCELRKKMFDSNSIFVWFRIAIKYRCFYVSNWSCLGDLYFLLGLGK